MAPARKYWLVIQVPISSIGDFDRMVEAEERIEALLKDLGQVDGHDAGSGEGNIFIRTDEPQLAFQKALPCLDERIRELARVAYREADAEAFTILWPPGLQEFRVL
jgi:hypothetical protein